MNANKLKYIAKTPLEGKKGRNLHSSLDVAVFFPIL
jgi:hypothetical protein